MDKISVLIVDDHDVVRQGLQTFLDLMEDIEVVGQASNGVEAIAQTNRLNPDIILMDLMMPEMDGIEATRQISSTNPSTKVIVLSSFSDDNKVFSAIKAGASGYLLKNISSAELADAIRAVHKGDPRLHPEIAKKLMNQFVGLKGESEAISKDLTPREIEVLRLIAEGMNNTELAQALFISETTAKTHVHNILSKLDLSDRTQAAIYAYRHGLVSEK
ncbi:MAG: response regulator transcription factor [Spirochaetaceae bacterium]|nr:MAG: response regulator transcription factor [Spirochaetaceae bacterium]